MVTKEAYSRGMVDSFGIGGSVMDYHNFDDSHFQEFGVEYFRITQALLQAGIEIHMLSPMDRSRVAAALWIDNTLFEEAGALMRMQYQSFGLLDAMHVTDAEKAAKIEKLGHKLDEIEVSLSDLEGQWLSLTPEQRKLVQKDWDARSKNIAVYYYEMEEQRLQGALPAEMAAAFRLFESMTSPQLGAVNPLYHEERMHLIEQSRLERVTQQALQSEMPSILADFNLKMESVDVHKELSSALDKPENYWTDRYMAEKNGGRAPAEQASGAPAPAKTDGQSWEEFSKEQREYEVELNKQTAQSA